MYQKPLTTETILNPDDKGNRVLRRDTQWSGGIAIFSTLERVVLYVFLKQRNWNLLCQDYAE